MAELYRRGVGIIVVNPKGTVLVAARVEERAPLWQFPQGGIDEGESPQTAMYRELQEEVGITSIRLIHAGHKWYRYEVPPSYRPAQWDNKFVGQEQKWYLVAFDGQEQEITLSHKIPEFKSWRWVPFSQTPDLVIGFKHALYKELVTDFTPFIETYLHD